MFLKYTHAVHLDLLPRRAPVIGDPMGSADPVIIIAVIVVAGILQREFECAVDIKIDLAVIA